MNTWWLYVVLMALFSLVIAPWGVVVARGFSRNKGRITRRRKKWVLFPVAVFYSLGGLVVVPALVGAYYVLTTGDALNGLPGIILGVAAFGVWFPAARRVGLWEIWRDIFSQYSDKNL